MRNARPTSDRRPPKGEPTGPKGEPTQKSAPPDATQRTAPSSARANDPTVKRAAARAEPTRRRRARWSPFGGPPRNRRVRLTGVPLPSPRKLGAAFAGFVRARRRAVLGVFVGLSVVTLLGGVARLVLRSHHFAVAHVRVLPAPRHVTEQALLARAAIAPGTHLFSVDLAAVAQRVSEEPWVDKVRVRRELPSSIVLDITEREPAAVAALGALYVIDGRGVAFKRATPDEAAAWPVVTGVDRERYLDDAEGARADLREALAVIAAWSQNAGRPALGEVHLDGGQGARGTGGAAAVTVYTQKGGVGVRLGRLDATLAARLARFDAVWAALQASQEKPRLLYLDNRARPDRVTVKLATPVQPTRSPAAPPQKNSET